MYPLHSLILSLLLICSSFAAPIPEPTPTPIDHGPAIWKPLRAGGGIYNVKSSSFTGLYYVYTPALLQEFPGTSNSTRVPKR
ncbi:hypothetical protein LY76DRAFT_599364 [Colletotrichum caudatum]|nr:hypothetical protein LY76DRAFT_599364 [Colletotrichum caudatum]